MGVARTISSAKVLAAAALIAAQFVFAAGASPAAEGPALPPAEYKPLPVGTNIIYDKRTDTISEAKGYATVVKKNVGDKAATYVSLYALFGEYGTDTFVTYAGGQEPVESDLTSENRKKLETLWPLAVGKETTYRLDEASPRYVAIPQRWTVVLKVVGTETVDVGGRRFHTFVVEERGSSDLGMGFRGRKWYHPATGLIVRSQRTGTGTQRLGGNFPKVANLGQDETETLLLRGVDFPLGTSPELVAAAQGTAAVGGPDKTMRAEVERLKREAQEADRALKAREAEMARLKQSLAARRDEKSGAAGESFRGVEFGRYHALVIGIDNYKELPKLNTAINDARAVAEVLERDYGFSVTLLVDPDARQIVDKLDLYRETLGPKDNLLIYYAGHGWLDKGADRGYWLPVDARPKRRSGWVSNATVSDTLKTLGAKHVMVVADSCYSGTLTRSADVGTRTRTGDYWKRMAEKWARVAITSGGLEPVADAGGGGHSPFAKAFIDALGANPSVMDGTTLFSQMRRPVMVAAQQTPQYADVREAGHDGGDFLFVRKKN